MSETFDPKRLPTVANDNESVSAREAFRGMGDEKLNKILAMIPLIVEMTRKSATEARTKESFENIKREKQLNQNELLATNVETLLVNQTESVDLLRELLEVVKGLKDSGNQDGNNPLSNLISPRMARILAGGAAALFAGGVLAGGMRYLLGDEEEIQQREDIQEQERTEQRQREDAALQPRGMGSDELADAGRQAVQNAETVEQAEQNARRMAMSYGHAEGTPEYERIMESAREQFRERPTSTPATPPVTPVTPVTPISPVVPPVTPAVTKNEAERAGVLSQEGKIITLPLDQVTPMMSTTPAVSIPTAPQATPIANDNVIPSSFTKNISQTDEAKVNDAVKTQELLQAEYERNPTLFANRDITIRAKNVVFSSDNVEFTQANNNTPRSNITPTSFTGGGSSIPSNPIAAITTLRSSGGGQVQGQPVSRSTSMGGQAPVSSGSGSGGGGGGGNPITEIVQVGPGFNVVKYGDGKTERRTGARNWRNNNPGNLEYGALAQRYGAIGSDGRFAIFPTYEMGRRAKEALLFEGRGYQGLTIAQAITRYAPPNENDTNRYISTVAAAIGAPANTPLQNLDAQQRQAMLAAMERVEGFRQGRVEVLQQGSGSTQTAEGSGTTTPGVTPTSATQSAEAGGGATLTPASGGEGVGQRVAQASQENAVAERTPASPSVTTVGGETPTGPNGNGSTAPPNYFSSPNDPGNVEPADAAERYARLFNMAA